MAVISFACTTVAAVAASLTDAVREKYSVVNGPVGPTYVLYEHAATFQLSAVRV